MSSQKEHVTALGNFRLGKVTSESLIQNLNMIAIQLRKLEEPTFEGLCPAIPSVGTVHHLFYLANLPFMIWLGHHLLCKPFLAPQGNYKLLPLGSRSTLRALRTSKWVSSLLLA